MIESFGTGSARARSITQDRASHPRRRTAHLRCASILASGVAFAAWAAPAAAQDRIYSGPGSDWNTGANWAGGDAANTAAETAVFQNNGAPTTVSIVSNTTVNGVRFSAGAPSRTINVSRVLALPGSGIDNQSGAVQTFNLNVGGALAVAGIQLYGTADVTGGQTNIEAVDGVLQISQQANATRAHAILAPEGELVLQASDGTVTLGALSGNGIVHSNINNGAAASQVLTVGGLNLSTTFAGVFNQDFLTTFGLTVAGTGTLTVTGNSAYTGLTTINAGATLQLGNGGTTGGIGPSAVVDNGTLVFNRSNALTFGNLISGTGTVVSSGSGTTTLTAANSYSGGTTLNSGTLLAGNAAAFGTGGVTFAGNAAIGTAGASATINGVTINAGQSATLGAAAGDTLTLTGALQMANAAGTSLHFGSASLTGLVDFAFNSVGFIPNAGSVSIDGGTLRQNGSAGLFFLNVNGGMTIASAATYDLNGFIGAGVNVSGGGTITNNGGSAAQFQAQQTATTTFSGVIQDGSRATSLLVRGSAGTLVLTGANTYSGATTFSGNSTLQVGNGGTTGSIGGGTIDLTGGRLSINRSDAVTFANTLSGSGIFVQAGSGITTLTGSNIYSGGSTINVGTLLAGSANALGTGAVTFAANGTLGTAAGVSSTVNGLTVVAGTTATVGAATGQTLSFTGALQMANAVGTSLHFGSAALNGIVDFAFGSVGFIPNSGTISIDGGTLRQNGSAGLFFLNVNGGMNIGSGATYDLNGFIGAGVNVTGGGTITNNGASAAQFQAQQTATTTFGGVIQDGARATSLLVRGTAGTLILTGASTYSGATAFSGNSTLQIGNGGTTGSIGSGTVDLTNGRLSVDRSDAVTLANTLSGTGTFIQAGPGTTTLTGTNTYSGGSTISGGTLLAGSATALGTGAVTFATNSTLGTTAGTSSTVNGLTINAGIIATVGASTGQTLSLAGALQMANAAGTSLHFGSASLTGIVDFGFNSVGFIPNSGTISIDGGTLRQNGSAGLFFLNVNGGMNIGSGATYDLNGFIGAGVNVTGGGTITNNGASAAQFQAQQTATTTFGGVIQDGARATSLLVRGSGGTLILTGASTYSGTTTFSGNSTLQLGNGGAGGSIGNGGIDLTNGRLVVNRSNAITLAGVISGTGSLSQVGGGATTLTGANTYSGGTTAANGTLELGSNTALGTGVVTLSGGDLRAISNVTLANSLNVLANTDTRISAAAGQVLALTGPFGVTGVQPGLTTILRFGSTADTGRVDFNGPNVGSFITGGVGAFSMTVEGGTLRDVAGLLSFFTRNAASVRVDGGATLDYSLLTGSLADIGTLTGAGTVVAPNLASSQVRIRAGDFSGAIIGNGGLNKTGPGTLTLTGANTYGGVTSIEAGGTLQVGNGGATGSIANSSLIAVNGQLIFDTSGNTSVGTVIGGGSVNQDGTGRLVFNGTNSIGSEFTGVINVDAGTVVINGQVGDTTNRLADLIVNNGGTLGGSGTFFGDVTVADGGTVNPGNSPGTLTVAGNYTLNAGSISNFELSQPNVVGGPGNDLINVGGNLTLDGTLNVTALPGFGAGYYRLFSYGGTFTDNGLNFGSLPAGYTPTLLTNVAGQVNLLFGNGPGGQLIQYWDGLDTGGFSADPTGNGGPGIWNATNTNWTVPPGWNFNDQWRSQVGVFAGTSGGLVTVQGTQTFQELRFQQGGYSLNGVGSLATTGGFSVIDVSAGIDASITVNIGGAGGLTKTGDGLLQLNGAVTSGLTTAAGGTLVLGGVGLITNGVQNNATFTNFGTVNGGVVNTGTLNSFGSISGGLNNSGLASINGQLIGAVANSGTLLLNGPVSGIGAFTQTAAGTTTLNSDIVFGSLAGAGILNLGLGTLTSGGDNSSTLFAGTIVGDGGITKVGTGTLTLSGANTYGGQTAVNAGVLNIANSTALGTTAGPTNVATGAALELQGNIAVGNELLMLNGTGVANGGVLRSVAGNNSMAGTVFISGANVRFAADAGSLTLSGSITGSGNALSIGGAGNMLLSGSISGLTSLTKDGSGFLALSGANLFTGPTVVNAGVLQTQSGASLSNTAGITIASGAAWQLFSNETVGSIAGAGLIALGTSTVTAGGDNSSTSFSGAINGTGGLIKVGAGTLTLSGANTYTGLTTIGAGILSVSGGAAIADTSAVVIASGGTLNLASPEAVGSLSGVAGSAVTLGANSLVIGGDNSSTSFLGVISGSGGLVKTGTGTQTLGGANTYTGSTVIDSGTLSLSGGAAIADTGAVAINAAGTLNLASSETIGSLSGMAGSQVMLGANTLTAGGNNASTLFDGVISGTGALTKVGTGTLVLGGGNTYSGTTTISAGGLQIGNGGTTGAIGTGAIVDNGVFTIARSNAATLANNISGTGMLVQGGSGTTTLSGTNSYSGGTLVSAGRLIGTTASLQGNIQDNAALEFSQTTNGVYAGRVAGAGTLDKTGTGLVELTGDNSLLTGATNVRAGELRVSNLLNHSAATVLSGGTLSGTSVVGGLIVQSGGTVSPGAGATGIGTLGVNGNIALATGSTYAAQLLGPAGADLLLGNGTASVAGTLALGNLGGTYAFNSTYVVLQAASRTGTFDALAGTTAFGVLYRPELVYNATQVIVRLAPNTLANIIGNQAVTYNEQSVQQRIDAAVAGGYNPQPLFAIYNLPQAQIPAALDQLSGEVYAAAAGAGIEQERLVREAVLNRLASTAAMARADADAARGAGMWGQAFGSWGDTDGDGNAAGADTDRTGFAVGIDVGGARENGSWRVGAFGQYVKTRVGIDGLGSRAEIEQTGGGLYAGFTSGGFGASLGGSYTQIDLSARRAVALPGFSETDRGEGDGESYQGFAEISYAIPSGNWTFRPFIAGHIGSFKIDALTETGGAAALSVGRQDYTDATGTAGVNAMAGLGRLRLSGTLAARAQFGDRDMHLPIALAAAPGQAYDIRGVQLDDVVLSAQLDATLRLGRRVDLSVGYSGLIGNTTRDHGVRATLAIHF